MHSRDNPLTILYPSIEGGCINYSIGFYSMFNCVGAVTLFAGCAAAGAAGCEGQCPLHSTAAGSWGAANRQSQPARDRCGHDRAQHPRWHHKEPLQHSSLRWGVLLWHCRSCLLRPLRLCNRSASVFSIGSDFCLEVAPVVDKSACTSPP